MRVTELNVDEICMYHPPVGDQVERYTVLRSTLHAALSTILVNVNESAERTRGINMILDGFMILNRAIALEKVQGV